MIDVDIIKLAELSRVAVTKTELIQLQQEIPAILEFVDQITQAGGEIQKETGTHYNIFREDVDPHESGIYSTDLIKAMPLATTDGYLKVRKILSQD